MIRVVAIALLTLSAVVAACALDDHPVLYIENDTTMPVDVIIVYPAAEITITRELAPGRAIPWDRMGTCDDAFVVARTADGREVARSGSPVCRPSTWVITSEAVPPAS